MPDFYNLGDLIAPSHDLDQIALIDLGGEQAPRQVTYRALNALSMSVARALTQRHLQPGARIAILSANLT